ncbi:MAG: N-acyl homoserine lactonase family protein [Pseudomonadota bacterium]
MKREFMAALVLVALSACGGSDPSDTSEEIVVAPLSASLEAPSGVTQLELHKLDCGTIEISDLDDFSSAGDFAGETDTFNNTCWLVRHPDGDLLWDTGVPGMLAGQPAFAQDIYTVSLNTSVTQQLRERGISTTEIEFVSISHSHFDHVGQIDQVSGATWLVHENEYNHMFSGAVEGDETATQFGAFASMAFEMFSGEKDVFGDGSVVIFPTAGHTPGHTSLQLTLPETGPVLLTGDLYHRTESRELRRVPRFNTSEADTLASMDAFEGRAAALGATVIIQHEIDDTGPLPNVIR